MPILWRTSLICCPSLLQLLQHLLPTHASEWSDRLLEILRSSDDCFWKTRKRQLAEEEAGSQLRFPSLWDDKHLSSVESRVSPRERDKREDRVHTAMLRFTLIVSPSQ